MITGTVLAMKDFTAKPRVVQFTVDGEIYRGRPYLPAQTMVDFTLKVEKMGDSASGSQGFETMMDSLQMVLMPDSYRKLRERMNDPLAEDASNGTSNPYQPIELPQLTEILQWLMEEYGMRPTQPSTASPSGQPSPESGTSSTANTSDRESISASSPTTDS